MILGSAVVQNVATNLVREIVAVVVTFCVETAVVVETDVVVEVSVIG